MVTTNQINNMEIQTPQKTGHAPMLVELADRMGVSPSQAFSVIRKTIAPKANEQELMAFCIVANQYKLNPFLKEIYAFPNKNGGIVPIVGIDGWLRLINTHPDFDGLSVEMGKDGTECTCRIYKKGMSHPVEVTEYLDECRRSTEPWKQWPRRMLRHKAIIQCGRVAFGFGGIYDEDEGRETAGIRNATPEKRERPKATATPWDGAKPEPVIEVATEAEETPADEPEEGDFIPGLDLPDEEAGAPENREDY